MLTGVTLVATVAFSGASIDVPMIANVMPADVDIAALKHSVVENRLVVNDDAGFALDINEFGVSG